VSISLLYWGAPHWTQHSRCASPVQRGWIASLDWPAVFLPVQCRRLLATFAIRAVCWLTFTLLTTRTLLPSCFPTSGSPASLSAWGCSSPSAGLCLSLSQTSPDSCLHTPPACPDPSEWQYTHLVYQPLLPICYLQMCEGCTLFHQQRHQQRPSVVLESVFTPRVHH